MAQQFVHGPDVVGPIPRTAQNRAGALTLINFVLRPQEQVKIARAVEGFPSIRFAYMPRSVAKHIGALTRGFSYWPSGQWSADLEKGWAANVPVGR